MWFNRQLYFSGWPGRAPCSNSGSIRPFFTCCLSPLSTPVSSSSVPASTSPPPLKAFSLKTSFKGLSWSGVLNGKTYCFQSQVLIHIFFFNKLIKQMIDWSALNSNFIPVRYLYRQLLKFEKSTLRVLPNYADVIVTSILLLAFIVTAIFLVFFVSFHLYTESVRFSKQLSGLIFFGRTMIMFLFAAPYSSTKWKGGCQIGQHHDLQANEWQSSRALFIGPRPIRRQRWEDLENIFPIRTAHYQKFDRNFSGYHYGRDLISGSFFSLIRKSDVTIDSDSDHSVDEFESKVLELWDRLYQVITHLYHLHESTLLWKLSLSHSDFPLYLVLELWIWQFDRFCESAICGWPFRCRDSSGGRYIRILGRRIHSGTTQSNFYQLQGPLKASLRVCCQQHGDTDIRARARY